MRSAKSLVRVFKSTTLLDSSFILHPSSLFYGVAQHSQSVNLHFHDIAALQEHRRFAGETDARGRAGENEVSWLQGEDLGQVRQGGPDAENHLPGGAVLHRFAVE